MTKLKYKIPHGCGTNAVLKHWKKFDITKDWENTVWARKLHRKSLRAAMTDFDRFKVMVARQQVSRYITYNCDEILEEPSALLMISFSDNFIPTR
ncbi:unnamed protein product [Heterobilharzia americana]|nr:unnamed protein product [Heterobilharzia americana]